MHFENEEKRKPIGAVEQSTADVFDVTDQTERRQRRINVAAALEAGAGQLAHNLLPTLVPAAPQFDAIAGSERRQRLEEKLLDASRLGVDHRGAVLMPLRPNRSSRVSFILPSLIWMGSFIFSTKRLCCHRGIAALAVSLVLTYFLVNCNWQKRRMSEKCNNLIRGLRYLMGSS